MVDSRTRHILNTVPIKSPADEDAFDVPYWLRPGYSYEVSGPLSLGAGKPRVFQLQDFNADGQALEFAFFDFAACSGPHNPILGYSILQDRIISYPFVLTGKIYGERREEEFWMDRFTKQEPVDSEHWRYGIWWNSGITVEYDFRYDPLKERYVGSVRGRQP